MVEAAFRSDAGKDDGNTDMEQEGVVFGKTGTYKFDFVVTGEIERNDYIQVRHHEHGWLLAYVNEVQIQTDLSDGGAKRIGAGEEIQFERSDIGHASVIGFPDGRGGMSQPGTPVAPGSRVFRASDELISCTLGLNKRKNGAFIGHLRGRNIPVVLDINVMVQKHISVMAKTGGGKSYLAGVIIEEMIKNGVTVVILDPHGEYGTLRERRNAAEASCDYPGIVREFAFDTEINIGASKMLLTLSNFTPQELLSLTSFRESRQHLMLLTAAMEEAKSGGSCDLRTVAEKLDSGDSQYSKQLASELKSIDGTGIFATEGTKITEMVVQGKTTVLNLKGTSPELQSLFVKRILTALFELRKRNKIPPLLAVLEEAHNFCPQQGKTDASRIIRTIASEGRKFGLGLMVITQRAAKVDKNVISQCNTQFILKITNPIDLKVVYTSIEGLTQEIVEEVPRLQTGVCIGIGGGLQLPMIIEVRERETVHGGDSTNVVSG